MASKTTAEKLATIQKGYTLEGATIELGAAIIDGELVQERPDARIVHGQAEDHQAGGIKRPGTKVRFCGHVSVLSDGGWFWSCWF